MADSKAVSSSEIARLMDTGIEDLRWCRQHLGERGVPERLRKLELSLAALALALDYEMDGQRQKAVQAMEKADWQYKPQSYFFDPHGWDH